MNLEGLFLLPPVSALAAAKCAGGPPLRRFDHGAGGRPAPDASGPRDLPRCPGSAVPPPPLTSGRGGDSCAQRNSRGARAGVSMGLSMRAGRRRPGARALDFGLPAAMGPEGGPGQGTRSAAAAVLAGPSI